jgi:hypothetical protein
LKVFEVTDRARVWEYFHAKLKVNNTADFRGVLHVPIEFQNEVASMDHVGIAVGYACFTGKTCCMHTVISRPELVTPRIVRETFEFPFLVCDLEAVLALVDSTNAAALNFDTKLGFREFHRIENGGIDGDLVMLEMLRSDCRWLRKPH